MSRIMTVAGEIAPEELGLTSMHEHTLHKASALSGVMLSGIPDMVRGIRSFEGGNDVKAERCRRKEQNYKIPSISVSDVLHSMKLERGNPASALTQEEYYLRELQIFAEHGGKSICDCSPLLQGSFSLAPIRELSLRSHVNIITAAGYYTKHMIPRRDYQAGEDFMQQQIEQMLEIGDPDSGVRPGFVKAAIGTVESGKISPWELAAVRVAARAAGNHGLSLHIHAAFPVRASMICTLAEQLEHEMQINPQKVIFCHMDSYSMGMTNPSACIGAEGYDLRLPRYLCRRGFNIGLDTWGIASRNEDTRQYALRARREMLLQLVSDGFASQITLGHDMMSVGSGGQNHGSGYILWPDTLRDLKNESLLSEENYRLLTTINPARILASDRL